MLHTTPQERLALGVTALLLATGAGVRLLAGDPPAVEWDGGVADTTPQGDLRALRASADEQARLDRVRAEPLAPGERLDANRASAAELERLPRVGPGLAARIVAHRQVHGAFRTLGDFDAVPGVGPAALAAIAPHLALPAGPAPSGGRGGEARLDVNRATAAELEALPGIGAALAARIVAWREAQGPFRSVEEIERVPGIGPALRERLAPRLRTGP